MADQTIGEEWRPVVGYEGLYEVSNLGRVRSVRRAGATGGPRKQRDDGRGYRHVFLSSDNHKRCMKVHTLVLMAFCGPAPDGFECDHLNGDPSDNRLCNLEWVSKATNNARRVQRAGGNPGVRGMANGRSKLHPLAVRAVRHAKTQCPDMQTAWIARGLGVCQNTLKQAIVGRSWRHT